jgi:beta-fructofuranosidase
MNFPTPPKLTTAFSDQSINRPQFHFTPEFGWMNDPNGLWTDGETYHLYYQYNPADTVWALPLYWGHATSKDLITWNHEKENPLPIGPIAISADNKYITNEDVSQVDPGSGAYSGSIFIDDKDQSGWFNRESDKNIIAAWTYNYPENEAQWLSFSLDGGNTFHNPVDRDEKAVNPMVSEGEKIFHFRDPQVIKLNDTKTIGEKEKNVYIMTVAKPQEYKIFFYASTEISSGWDKQIDLELEGFLGYQYECPNLIHLYNANTTKDDFVDEGYKESYWVLFISINPGSISGGSSTWYLIGQFGENKDKGSLYEFTPTYHYPAPLDYGKDFYAMQIMYNSGEFVDSTQDIGKGYKSYIGIAWASNWQYTGLVPTDPWRSSMSLARKVSLGFFQSSPERKILYVKSEPYMKGNYFSCNETTSLIANYSQDTTKYYNIDDPTGSFKFEMVYKVNTSEFSNINPGHLDIQFNCIDPSEYLLIGYENEASAFYVDRSHSNVEFVHKNPYFSDKISVNVQPKIEELKIKTFEVIGFVDRNIIELFFNDGYQTMTNTFFFTGGNFFNQITISADYGNDGYEISKFNFCPFSQTNSP